MSRFFFFFFFYLISFSFYGQNVHLQFLSQDLEPVPYVRVTRQSTVFYSDQNGHLSLPYLPKDSIKIYAFSFSDTSIIIPSEDSLTLLLKTKNTLLEEVSIYAKTISQHVIMLPKNHFFYAKKDYQREPGEVFLIEQSCTQCRLDSIVVNIREIMYENSGLRAVAYHGTEEIANGKVITFEKGFTGNVTLPINQESAILEDSIYWGIEFIRLNYKSRKNSNVASVFRTRGKKGLYTPRNNGVTLEGFKLRNKEYHTYLICHLHGDKYITKINAGLFGYAPLLQLYVSELQWISSANFIS